MRLSTVHLHDTVFININNFQTKNNRIAKSWRKSTSKSVLYTLTQANVCLNSIFVCLVFMMNCSYSWLLCSVKVCIVHSRKSYIQLKDRRIALYSFMYPLLEYNQTNHFIIYSWFKMKNMFIFLYLLVIQPIPQINTDTFQTFPYQCK